MQKSLGLIECPPITVITVVLNGEAYIESTILSVINQTYRNLQYIVIDGGSTDRTVDIIKKYEDKIDYWSSEKDNGIYDAMNKGLSMASGRWVNFMNSGDVFYRPDTIENIFGRGKQTAMMVYGGVEISYTDLIRIQWPGPLKNLWQGMQFCHQSVFIDIEYHRSHPFNCSNKIAADLEFFYKAHKKKATFFNCGRVISRVKAGGLSDSNRIKSILASQEAICGHEFRLFIRSYYTIRILNSIIRSIAKRCLPRSIIKRIILLK